MIQLRTLYGMALALSCSALFAACGDTPPPPNGIFCGGIAGIQCPGQGVCIDDPSDDCDPEQGGADCGGVCSCPRDRECDSGYQFDGSPDVCDCVPANPCAVVLCQTGTVCEVHDGAAVCVSDGSLACGRTTCAEGMVCCNASCGICTPPDGVCIQIACE